MKISNLFKIAIASLSLVTLAGCASSPLQPVHVESAVYEADSSYQVSNSDFINNIRVSAKGFKGTEKNVLSGNAGADLFDHTAVEAISESLASANLHNNNGRYQLEVTSVLNDAMTGKEFFTTRNFGKMLLTVIVDYKLYYNTRLIYDREIKTSAESASSGNLFTKQRLALEEAYKLNFKELMKDLSEIAPQ